LNIALINPRLRAWNPNVIMPLGLLYIGTVLLNKGHEVDIIDMNAENISTQAMLTRIKDSDIVGLTGMITEYKQIVALSQTIKSTYDIKPVIIGGPLATSFPEELIKYAKADYIVMGEGERAILEAITLPSNRIIQHTQISDLDTIPIPNRSLIKHNLYVENQFHSSKESNVRTTPIITSRGCPYSCTFCYKGMWGKKWRARSPQNIIREMSNLYNQYGINGFIIQDDTFILDKHRVLDLCNRIKDLKFKPKWLCNGRVNLVTPRLCHEMAEAGCVEIAFGIESGNQTILDSINKDTDLGTIENAVRWSKAAGLRVNGYFIIGLPGETKDTIRQTIAFAKELDLDLYGFSLYTPLPGTECYTGNTAIEDWNFKANVNLTKDCTDEDLINFKYEVMRKFTIGSLGKIYLTRSILKIILGIRGPKEFLSVANKVKGVIKSFWIK